VQHKYRIGEEYTDRGTPDPADDQFMRWLRGPLDAGIRNAGGIRTVSSEISDNTACVVLISNTGADPWAFDALWEDSIDLSNGTVEYWGDAKADDVRQLDDFRGNKILSRITERVASGNRSDVPPILLFTKPEKGVVKFCGLCIVDHAEIRTFEHGEEQVPNYLFHLRILDEETVSVGWIHERATSRAVSSAPDSWIQWVETGTVKQWSSIERTNTRTSTSDSTIQDSSRNEFDIVARQYEQIDRSVSETFRKDVWGRYNRKCLFTGIDCPAVLEVSHILPRSDHPELAEHPDNAILMNVLHHRAFDGGIFTLDDNRTFRVNPAFDTDNEFLNKMIVDFDGKRPKLPTEANIDAEFLRQRNKDLEWWRLKR